VKSILVKFLLASLMVGLAVLFLQAKPLVNQVSTPTVAPRPEAVAPPPGVKHLQQVEDLVFAMTNRARQARGLAPLIRDNELRNVARAYSNNMTVHRFFDHVTPEGISLDDRISSQYPHWVRAIGENIWKGVGFNPLAVRRLAQEIMDDWMSSPGHRENVLDPDFTHLGVGVSARHHTIHATQEFVGRLKTSNFGEIIHNLM
jgi:uncharacterized protein YkwD